MTTVILPTGKTFTAAWAADAFEHLWAAEVIGADVVEIVTQFPGNDEILVKTDGMRDITCYGYKYLDSDHPEKRGVTWRRIYTQRQSTYDRESGCTASDDCLLRMTNWRIGSTSR